MSSFHAIRFPSSISFKAEGGPVFKTEIASLKNGKEKRNILWSQARSEYEIYYKDISKNETNQVIAFFMARNGSAYGFLFKDWNDFEAKGEVIGTGDDSTTDFQLTKEYGDAQNKYKRIIKKPAQDSVSIYVDGALQSSGYSVDYDDGVVSFDNPVPLDEVVTADFEFDIPVRFESDFLIAKNDSFSKSTIKSFKLIELKL